MFNRELVKGSTSLLLLQFLNERPMYGYELVKEMEKRSDNALSMKEGTMYPCLHKLEEKMYIESYWQEQPKGPRRKYYKITAEGIEVLQQKNKEWSDFVKVMNQVLGRDSNA
ncbi:PadR family transcriptional regulator [Anaerobacillus arseniciselenatis]|uniref:PadR family transcriptional regulator n=1 Tax=Anaerobacillus arseniciselenatis TaxID=85682 RepID=A0A1S2LSR2_9BACI|nr:PadR family transcriptional regulator [Anaerobacillus arseniciselenatis]OIJ15569.1 PadR family transcriptional regulator [Anaerobacillus arseniciselenatis]